MVDLRVIDMSEFDVILMMDWLLAHLVVIDSNQKRVFTYTSKGFCLKFQGENHNALPQAVYDSCWYGQLMG